MRVSSGPLSAMCVRLSELIRGSGTGEPCFLSAAAPASWRSHRIFTPADYRDLLDGSAIAVFLSAFETQGIALAEAWSMNVPTLVWDPRGNAEWRGRRFTSGSSAPYLTPATGAAFRAVDELQPVLERALRSAGSFQPREWVLANMTDAVCSRRLYELVREEAGRVGRSALAG